MAVEFHVITKIGALDREVVAREHAGRPARVVTASRTYDAPVEDVWDALTSAERIPRWFLPISGDLRLGGRYRLEGHAEGEVTTCERPRHLAVTWEYGGDVSWVDVRLAEDDGRRTILRLEHTAHVPDERWAEFGPGAVGVGWDMLLLLSLDEHLSTGRAVEFDGTAPAALEFMRRSSDEWGRAAVAGGTPEDEARAAAERTTAFYTGGEETAEP